VQIFVRDDNGEMVASFVDNTLFAGLDFDRFSLAGHLLALAHLLVVPPQVDERRVREIVAEMGSGAFYVPTDLGALDIEGGKANG